MSYTLQEKSPVDTLGLQFDRFLLPAAYLLLSIVILAPLTIIDIPFIADYPNHVARMHILGNVQTDPLLAERYASDFEFIPNLVMDLIVPLLAKVMPLDAAARLFLAATLLSTLASVAFLHWTLFNQWSFWPLITTLVVYHGSFMAGLINFSLGAGLVPAALALWIKMRYRPMGWRIAIGGVVALALFFCHLIAFGAYGLLVAGYESVRARDKWSRRDGPAQAARDFLAAALTGLVPLLLFLRQVVGREDADPDLDLGSTVVFGDWTWKAKALLSPLAHYNLPLDLLSFALLSGLGIWAWRFGRLDIERRVAPGLGMLALCFLFAPKAIWTGGVFDQRFAVLFILVLIGSARFETPSPLLRRGLLALLAVLLLVRLAFLAVNWDDHRGDLAEMRAAIGQMEEGARILVAEPDKTAGVRLAPPRHRVFHHGAQMASLPTLAVIEKSAFVSTIYAIPGQHPLRLLEPFDDLGGHGASHVPTLDDLADSLDQDHDLIAPQIRNWRNEFDYVVLLYGYGPGADDLGKDLPLETLMDGEILDLFKIKRPDSAPGS